MKIMKKKLINVVSQSRPLTTTDDEVYKLLGHFITENKVDWSMRVVVEPERCLVFIQKLRQFPPWLCFKTT